MKMSLSLLNYFINSKNMKTYQVPVGHYNFEYALNDYPEGAVFCNLELENEIITDLDDEVIGYFAINFENKILAYYLLR